MSGAISSVVRDVLSRDARPDEVSYFQAELNAGETLSDVRREVAGGSEAAGDISWLFANVVGRQAGAGDLAYWTGRLGSDVSLATIRQAFAYTGEAAGAIDAVYQRGLSRGATGGELGVYQNYLAYGGSLDGVRYGVFHSAEEDYAVDNIYRSILDRPARMDEIRVFEENALGQGGTLADVRQIVAHSAEAAGDIAGLFRTELGREAGAGDLGYWTGRLQDGVALVTIRHAFAYTGEAAGWIQDAYQRGLGRSAGAGEQGTWQDYLANGGSIEGMRYGVFHSSSEFDVLDGLYREMLGHGIRPDEAAVFENDALGRGATLAGIRNIIAYSPEAAQDVDSSYRQVTGRGATSPEVASFQFALTVGGVWTHAGVRWAIGHSDAAAAAVDGVAQSVLGHAIDPALKAAYEDQMGGAGRRSLDDVRWDLAHRPEAAAVVTGLYRELLGRDPQAGAGEVTWAEDSLGRGVTLADLKLVVAHSSEAQKDFDAAYYLAQNPDVAQSGMDPYVHYVTTGWKEGRNPSALFDTTYYLDMNPDVAAAGVNPLLHYRTTGWREGRDPSVQFNTRAYLAANPDVAAASIDPLAHYVTSGRSEGRTAFAARPDATLVAQSVMIDDFYYRLFARGALAAEKGTIELTVRAGQPLDQVLTYLRGQFATSPSETGTINAFYQSSFHRDATQPELDVIEASLAAGQSLLDIEAALNPGVPLPGSGDARVKIIHAFYQQLFGRNALANEVAGFLRGMASGLHIQDIIAALRPQFATSDSAKGVINAFYRDVAHRDAYDGEITAIEAHLAAGEKLADIENSLRPPLQAAATQIQAAAVAIQQARDTLIAGLYTELTGVAASLDIVQGAQDALTFGASLLDVRYDFAHLSETAEAINSIFFDVLNRSASDAEIASWQDNLAGSSTLASVRAYLVQNYSAGQVNRIYTEVLRRTVDQRCMLQGLAELAAGGSLGQLRSEVAHSVEAGIVVSAAVQTSTGLNAEPTSLSKIEAALAAGATLDAIEIGLVRTVNEVSTYDGHGEITSTSLVLDPFLTARNAAAGFYRAVLGREPTLDEMVGFDAALSTDLSPNSRLTILDQNGKVLGEATADRLLLELPVFVTLNDGATPLLIVPGQAHPLSDGAQVAAFLLGMEGRAGRLDAKALAIYGEASAWLDRVGQQLLQLASLMAHASQVDGGDRRIIENEIVKLAVSLAAVPPELRAHAAATSLIERLTLHGHQADLSLVIDPLTGEWTYKVHDIDTTDVFRIVVQAITLIASAVLTLATAGGASPLLVLSATEIAVVTAVSVVGSVVLAGQSFANGDVLGGLLSLASAVGVTLQTNLLGFSDVAQAQKIGGLILAARGIVGGAAAAVQAAERGNTLGFVSGLLEVAAAGASGDIAIQGRGVGDALLDVGNFLNGIATATSIADAFNRGDVQGGLFASLSGVLHAFSINRDIERRQSRSSIVCAPERSADSGDDETTRGNVVSDSDPALLYGMTPNGTLIGPAGNNQYLRRETETDESWLARLSARTDEINRTTFSNPGSAISARRELNSAITSDQAFQAGYYASAQNITQDAFRNPSRYGTKVASQGIGSGAYESSNLDDRLRLFTADSQSPTLRMGADGLIYDFSRSLSAATDADSASAGLAALLISNMNITENLGELVRQYGYKAVPPELISAALIGAIAGKGPGRGVNANIYFKQEHYVTRLNRLGINVDDVETKVLSVVQRISPEIPVRQNQYLSLEYDGRTVNFRFIKSEDGSVSVGTIHIDLKK